MKHDHTSRALKRRLAAVIATLETVEVRGRANLDALLACMVELEALRRGPEAGEATP